MVPNTSRERHLFHDTMTAVMHTNIGINFTRG
jgi:hypothetical protein